jgi:hypothetical protein
MQTSFYHWWNIFPNNLQWREDAECYDKVMESHPNYPKIWWDKAVLPFKQKKD